MPNRFGINIATDATIYLIVPRPTLVSETDGAKIFSLKKEMYSMLEAMS